MGKKVSCRFKKNVNKTSLISTAVLDREIGDTYADFVHNLPIITAVMHNHCDGQKSRHMAKIKVSKINMIFLQP